MRITNKPNLVQVKSDEQSWLFVLGFSFFAFMAWHLASNISAFWPGVFLWFIGFSIWLILLYKSSNNVFTVFIESDCRVFKRTWFGKKLLK